MHVFMTSLIILKPWKSFSFQSSDSWKKFLLWEILNKCQQKISVPGSPQPPCSTSLSPLWLRPLPAPPMRKRMILPQTCAMSDIKCTKIRMRNLTYTHTRNTFWGSRLPVALPWVPPPEDTLCWYLPCHIIFFLFKTWDLANLVIYIYYFFL